MSNLVVINDSNWQQFVEPPTGYAKGAIPRDYKRYPVGYAACAAAFDLPLIPESEWEARLAEQKAKRAQLSDIRNTGLNGQRIPSTDQNARGYCWAHGPVSAMLLARAVAGMPFADLSAYAIACIIKNYRDEGGWGIQAIEFMAERGCPTSEFWPQRSVSRENDNPATWENAKLHRQTEWMDLEPRNKAQLVTCLLSNIPVCAGYNWWAHEICIMDLVSINPFQVRIWNSWGDKWSENGTGILEGQKALGDGWEAIRVVTPSSE